MGSDLILVPPVGFVFLEAAGRRGDVHVRIYSPQYTYVYVMHGRKALFYNRLYICFQKSICA